MTASQIKDQIMFKIFCNGKVVATAATEEEAWILTRKFNNELEGSVYFTEAECNARQILAS